MALQSSALPAGLKANVAGGEFAAELVQPPLGSGLFPETLLGAAAIMASTGAPLPPGSQPPLMITRQRPVGFTIHEGGYSTAHATVYLTVGQALASHGVRVEEGDLISPAADSLLTPGAHVYISRAVGVRLVVAGSEQQIKTRGETVKDVLAEAGVGLQPLDRVTPRPSRSITPGMTIRVTTVRDLTEVVEETIAYASVTHHDAALPSGQRVIAQGGSSGLVRREYKVRQVNGRVTRRELASETVVPATEEIVVIGTYVKPATPAPVVAAAVAAPAGDVSCARTLHLYATWYTAASAGGGGTTATGTAVYKGIVAVDPRVIPLGTRMYIPGYGYGIAADTGGAIVGNIIDLGYGPDDVKDWRTRWVDVCLM
jgi:uncharacterized protein YabE (DUF348 family)